MLDKKRLEGGIMRLRVSYEMALALHGTVEERLSDLNAGFGELFKGEAAASRELLDKLRGALDRWARETQAQAHHG